MMILFFDRHDTGDRLDLFQTVKEEVALRDCSVHPGAIAAACVQSYGCRENAYHYIEGIIRDGICEIADRAVEEQKQRKEESK